MTKITNFGTKDGTFQYVQNDGRIPVVINNVFGQMNVSSVWCQFIRDKTIKISIEKDDINLENLLEGCLSKNLI